MTLKPPSLTIGIEEEYQIIDPVTRELKSYITEILKEDVVLLGEVKPELHQSMVEVGHQGLSHAGRSAGRADPAPRAGDGTRGEERARDRGRGESPVLVVADPGDHAARALHRRAGGPGRSWRSGC